MESRDLLCPRCAEIQANISIGEASQIMLYCDACNLKDLQTDPSVAQIPNFLTTHYQTSEDLIIPDQELSSCLTQQLHNYRARLHKFKTDVQGSQSLMEEVLNKTFDRSLDHIESIDKDISKQLTVLELHTAVPTPEGLDLLSNFRELGLEGILNTYHSEMKISNGPLLEQLEKFIYISDRPETPKLRDEIESSYNLEELISSLTRELMEKNEIIAILKNERDGEQFSNEFEFVKSSAESSAKSDEGLKYLEKELTKKDNLIDELEVKLRKAKAKAKDFKESACYTHKICKENEEFKRQVQENTTQIIQRDQKIQSLKDYITHIQNQNTRAALDRHKDDRIKELEATVLQIQSLLSSDQILELSTLSNISGVQICESDDVSDNYREENRQLFERNQELEQGSNKLLGDISVIQQAKQDLEHMEDGRKSTDEVGHLRAEIDRLRQENAVLYQESNKFYGDFIAVQNAKQDLETSLDATSAELNRHQQESNKFYGDFIAVQNAKQDLETSLNVTSAKLNRHQHESANLQLDNSRLQLESDKLLTDLLAIQQAKQILEASLENSKLSFYPSDEKDNLQLESDKLLTDLLAVQQAKQILEASLENSKLSFYPSDESANLQLDNSRLQHESDKLLTDLLAVQKAKQTLEASLENSQLSFYPSDEKDNLQLENSRLQHELAKLLTDLLAVQKAKKDLEALLTSSSHTSNLAAQVNALTQENSHLNSEILSLKAKNNQLEQDYVRITHTIQTLRQDLSEKSSSFENSEHLKQKILDYYQNQENTFTAHVAHLNNKLKRIHDENNRLILENTTLKQTLASQEISSDDSNLEFVKELQGRIARKDDEIYNIQKELSITQEKLDNTTHSISLVYEELKDKTQETEQLKHNLQKEVLNSDALKNELEIATKRLASGSLPSSPHDNFQQLESEPSTQSQEVIRLSKNLKDANSHIAYLDAEIKTLKGQVSPAIQKFISEKNETISAQTSQVKALQSQLAEVQSENEKLQGNITMHKQIIENQQSQITHIKTQSMSLPLHMSDNENLKKQLAELRSENERLQGSITMYEQVIDDQNNQITHIKTQSMSLPIHMPDIENLNKQLFDYSRAYEIQRNELELARRSVYELEIRQENSIRLEKKNSELENELNSTKRRLESENKLRQEGSVRLEMRSKNIEAELEKYKRQAQMYADLEQRLKSERMEHEDQLAQLHFLKNDRENIMNEIQDKELTIQKIEKKAKEDIRNIQMDLDKQNETVSQVGQTLSLLESEKEALQKENDSIQLQKQASSVQSAQLEALSAQLLDSQRQITSLKSELLKFSSSDSSSLTSEASRSSQYSSHAGKRYIYLPLDTNLIEYDVFTNTQIQYDLSNQISRSFVNSSSCVLPNGDVFICGFMNPVSAEAYIFVVKNQKLIKLKDAPDAKYFVSVVFHADRVFALGGCDGESSKDTAAIFNLNQLQWEKLPEMNKPRIAASSLAAGEYIFIFGGDVQPSMEYLTIANNIFQMIEFNMSSNYVIAACYEELIYLVGERGVKIVDKGLRTVKDISIVSTLCYSINNVVTNGEIIYFLNNEKKVEILDTKTLSRDFLKNRFA